MPCLLKLLTASCPSPLLTFAAPRRNVETKEVHKTFTVQRALYCRRDFLLDRETEEGLLVGREADAIRRMLRLCSGGLLGAFNSGDQRLSHDNR